jgi:hypothetical protein
MQLRSQEEEKARDGKVVRGQEDELVSKAMLSGRIF